MTKQLLEKSDFLSQRDNSEDSNSPPLTYTDTDDPRWQQLLASRQIYTLRSVCRTHNWPLGHDIRNNMWLQLCSLHSNVELKQSNLVESVPGRKLPSLVDVTYCRFYHLNELGREYVDRILWSLARDYPEVAFCPLAYPLAALFLHYMNADDCFKCICSLLTANTPVKIRESYRSMLPRSRIQLCKDAFVLIKLSKSISVSLWPTLGLLRKQRDDLNKHRDLDPCIQEWPKWIFIGLPFEHLVRVVDCFLVEGFKFLMRVALALLILFRKSNRDEPTLDSMIEFCEKVPLSPQQLIRFSCSLSRLTTAKISKQFRKAEAAMRRYPHMNGLTCQPSPSAIRRGDMERDIKISSRVTPRGLKSKIIDWLLLDILWEWIPERIAVLEPTLVFTTNEDGCSLRTFFLKTETISPTLLLIATQSGEVIGAFCSEAWNRRRDSDGGYFGNGETFLFTLKPQVIKYPWIGDTLAAATTSTTSAASGNYSTQLFMNASANHLAIGAGNGIGLWLDQELSHGRTERCDTFQNHPLVHSIDFECALVEVIAFT